MMPDHCSFGPDHRLQPCDGMALIGDRTNSGPLRILSFANMRTGEFLGEQVVIHRSREKRLIARACPFCQASLRPERWQSTAAGEAA